MLQRHAFTWFLQSPLIFSLLCNRNHMPASLYCTSQTAYSHDKSNGREKARQAINSSKIWCLWTFESIWWNFSFLTLEIWVLPFSNPAHCVPPLSCTRLWVCEKIVNIHLRDIWLLYTNHSNQYSVSTIDNIHTKWDHPKMFTQNETVTSIISIM